MSDKKTIFYVGGFELPDKNAAALRILSNAKILRSLNYEVVLIGIYKDREKTLKIKSFEVEGFECWSIPYPKNKKEWLTYLTSVEYLIKLKKYYKNLTMCIFYNYPSLSLWRAFCYFRKIKVKVIADCTEWYNAEKDNLLFYILKKIDTFFRMRIIHKKLDGLILISNYLDKYYKKCKNKIIIPPLVDLNEDKWRCTKKELDNTIKIIYAGSPSKHKEKLDLVTKTIEKLSKKYLITFYILGITKTEFEKIYNGIVYNNIRFIGRIENKEVISYVKNSDFSFVIRESNRTTEAGFPTKLVESISCGTPVIVNKVSDVPQYVVNGKNGFIVRLENLEQDLELIFKDRKQMCFNTNIFDYRYYINDMKVFIDRM